MSGEYQEWAGVRFARRVLRSWARGRVSIPSRIPFEFLSFAFVGLAVPTATGKTKREKKVSSNPGKDDDRYRRRFSFDSFRYVKREKKKVQPRGFRKEREEERILRVLREEKRAKRGQGYGRTRRIPIQ